MKTSKVCPKCGGTDIYCDAGMSKNGERGYVQISFWSKMFFDIYMCTGCGFVEEYISDKDLNDEKTIAKLKESWKKN